MNLFLQALAKSGSLQPIHASLPRIACPTGLFVLLARADTSYQRRMAGGRVASVDFIEGYRDSPPGPLLLRDWCPETRLKQ